jgi:two-component system, chemotaxis family, chemotaxis protein CheY
MKVRDDLVQSINRKKPEGLNKLDEPYKVLVVDDSATMRKIIGQQLKTEAYDICGEASNGQEAVELYKEKEPDIVTLDINMPVMSGTEALKKILEWDKDARIVMLTSEGQRDIVVEAVSAGAQGYIVKPPNKMKVCAAVYKALND